MKIYTKTGDRGETSLFGGSRVAKDDLRVEAYGSVDELNAALGVARAGAPGAEIDGHLARVQEELFAVGAQLAAPRESRARGSVPGVEDAWAEALERAMDGWDAELPPLTAFVLPGGAAAAAALQLARAVARRAERRVVALSRAAEVDPRIVVYLNRLSDFLFVAARVANHRARAPEVLWHPGPRSER